ncbi:MAG: DUF1902 domain-containing protein [Terriglobales bacterium]
MTQPVRVNVLWDAEARVWVAESEDVPGLATEAPGLDALKAKLDVMIPELLAANGRLPAGTSLSIALRADYSEQLISA